MGVERTQEHVVKTKAAADKALELQPELPEAHVALGYYYYHCLRDYDRALEAFDEAGKWLPNQNDLIQHIGWIRRRQSKWDEALDNLTRSLELNPRDASLCRELGNTYTLLREYEKAERYYDRSIAIAPDQVASYVFKALCNWLRAGDIEGGRAALEALPLARDPFSVYFWSYQLMMERDYQAVLDRISSTPVDLVEMPSMILAKAQFTGAAYQLMGETERSRASFESARDLLEKAVLERPEDARIHSALGIAYAALGRRDEALREGKRAVEMIPVSEDALRGPTQIENLALIYMLLGEFDAAVDQVDYLLSTPSYVSVPYLRVAPFWDPIRDYPPFEAVLQKYSRTDT
jgi:serine/threonine-protein kinase